MEVNATRAQDGEGRPEKRYSAREVASAGEETCRVSAKALVRSGRAWINVAPAVPLREGTGCISLLRLWEDALFAAGLDLWDLWRTQREGGTAWGDGVRLS